jgi:hypothetical protein
MDCWRMDVSFEIWISGNNARNIEPVRANGNDCPAVAVEALRGTASFKAIYSQNDPSALL